MTDGQHTIVFNNRNCENTIMDEHLKATNLLCCPNCREPILSEEPDGIRCRSCGSSYRKVGSMPVLIKPDSPVLEWYRPETQAAPGKAMGAGRALRGLYRWIKPVARVWTMRSKRVLKKLVADCNPDDPERNVLLIGSGMEPVYRQILKPYRNVIRLGLPTRGGVHVAADVCGLPIVSSGLDLVLSSSVLEHVYDPESAVREMCRVLKPGGQVYAEIPFLRAGHMIPVDYQRYTIDGIEELFKRQGFTMVDKGICSGPFTAFAQLMIDFWGGLFSFSRYLQKAVMLLLAVIFHPFKFLDRFCENATWAEALACNFYYVGRKEPEGSQAS